MISWGGTSQQTENNSEAIDSLEESLEEKVDQGDIDEIYDRLDKIEEQIQTLKEDIAYLEGRKDRER